MKDGGSDPTEPTNFSKHQVFNREYNQEEPEDTKLTPPEGKLK